MSNHKKSGKFSLIIGVLGFISGIILLFDENWIIGIFGSIASVGILYKGYKDSKES